MTGDDVKSFTATARSLQPAALKLFDDLCAAAESLAREVDRERAASKADLERMQARADSLEKSLIAAVRQRDRFRLALHVYLQERDGLLGVHAPSLDTLNRIRELLEEPL